MRDTTPAPAHIVESLQSKLGRSHILRGLTALLLAIVTWGWVIQATDPINTTVYSEVEIVSPGFSDEMVMVTNLPRASIRVEGPESEVAKINRALLSLHLDTSEVDGPGQYRLPVVVEGPDTSNRVTVEPSFVQVQIDDVTSKVIPIEIQDTSTENATRVVNNINSDVSQVTVSGPSSAVDRVETVILPVTIDSQVTSFSEVYTPYAVDANGQRVAEVTVLPSQIRTQVQLQSRGRVVSVIPEITGQPADGYATQQRTVLPNSITVEGPEEALEGLLFVHTEPVDITGASESVSQRVGLADLPEGVVVVEPASGQVEVRIAIQDSSSSLQTLQNQPVSALSVPAGYEVSIEPPTIDVTLEGSLNTLSDMTSDDISVVVDVNGLEVGTHELTPVVALPNNGVLSSGTNPETVLVTIRPIEKSTPESGPSPVEASPNAIYVSTPHATVRRRYSTTGIAIQ